MTNVVLNKEKVKEAITASHDSGFPLLICLIATKACYIKFSGLVKALADGHYPFIALESGQHHETLLTAGADELGYRQHISGAMFMEGDLAGKSSDLFHALSTLHTQLKDMGVGRCLLAVCGDTLTAGIAPFAWYMISGQRSVHIESGLRSLAPKWEWMKDGNFLEQRVMPWEGRATRPFPEGLCTRIATVASQQLFAPVPRNQENLIAEGYDTESICVCGSPSVDAVQYASQHAVLCDHSLLEIARIRVDIHRRENLTWTRLNAIFDGLLRLRSDGIDIEFVVTKSMQNCKGTSWQQGDLISMEKAGIQISLQTASYLSVVRSLLGWTRALLTDSGGLQEEATILGIPCMTCRFETDRPETVLDFKTNILVPPKSGEFIWQSVAYCLSENPDKIWPGLGLNAWSYGTDVGTNVVTRLKAMTVEAGQEVVLK